MDAMLQAGPPLVKVAPMRLLPLLSLLILGSSLTAQTASLRSWVRADTGGRSVTIELAAVHTAGAPGPTLNGISNGRVQVVVPLGWTVVLEWQNSDSTATHSFIVQQEREKLPERAGEAAFQYAYSRSPVAGMPFGRTDRTQFVVDQAGWYWILCGVPGHAILGEYLGLKVDATSQGVSIVAH
jgi:sulfocyanin SoxE-like protein